jgi:hypothetical protein
LSILDFLSQACLLSILGGLSFLVGLFFGGTVSFGIFVLLSLEVGLSGFVIFALLPFFLILLVLSIEIVLVLAALIFGFFVKECLASSIVLLEALLFNSSFLLKFLCVLGFTSKTFFVLTIFVFLLVLELGLLLLLLKNFFLILFLLSNDILAFHLYLMLFLLFNHSQALEFCLFLAFIS